MSPVGSLPSSQTQYDLSFLYQAVTQSHPPTVDGELWIRRAFAKGRFHLYRYPHSWKVSDGSRLGRLRSVVVENSSSSSSSSPRPPRIVAFSPPKSVEWSFKENQVVSSFLEETVEGTMVNVFYSESHGWEMSTKKVVGGHNRFYTHCAKTFRDMFEEACQAHSLDWKTQLDPRYCYSFVLQHPDHRIVVPVREPRLYLIAVYEIQHDPQQPHVQVVSHDLCSSVVDAMVPSVLRPLRYNPQFVTEMGCVMDIARRRGVEPWMVPGLMWKKRIGKKDMQEQKTDDPNPEPEVQEDPDPELRSKWVNPLYHEVDELRGNSASLLVRYMNLRQRGCVARYLTHFPEHGTWFGQWSEKTHKLARRVYFVYRNCFIFKTTTLADASREQPWLSSVLNSLHYHYRTQLKPAGKVVTQSQVIQWLQSQPAERMAAWVSCI